MQIVDPVATRNDDTRRPAPRPATLEGVRLGLLHNGKPGGEEILQRVAERLHDEHGAVPVGSWRKPHPSAGATFLAEVAEACDVVVGALSD